MMLPVLIATISCATLRVPDSAPSFKPEQFARMQEAGLVLEAHAVTDREAYWDLFEDNLPEIGIAALWISIRNQRADSVSQEIRSWRLWLPGGECRVMSADDLFERYYERRRIRAYSVHADQEARDRLRPMLFDGVTPLRPGEMRSGFVFFRMPPAQLAVWLKDARLVLRDMRPAGKESITLELPLTYASP